VLSISRTTRVFLATEPTDMRKGFDGLFALVENVIREDPFSGHLFVFRNRRRDRLKVLWWDTDGLAIFYKRLERGNYQFPTDSVVSKSGTTKSGTTKSGATSSRCEIRSDELSLLLAGIDLGSVKRRRRYQRPSADGQLPSDRQPVSPA
jgi:transposase